jgi:uncharacterized DUF497 family protein
MMGGLSPVILRRCATNAHATVLAAGAAGPPWFSAIVAADAPEAVAASTAAVRPRPAGSSAPGHRVGSTSDGLAISTASPYLVQMDYEWDAAKDAENRRKHRLSLADGISALEDPDAESWVDERFDYGEERIVTLGRNNGRVLFVVTNEPAAELTRIISVRRAEKHEESWYYEGHPSPR